MSQATSPAAPAAHERTGGDAWRPRLASRMRAAGAALAEIPPSALELGRRLEADLGFRARAEVLQALTPFARCEDAVAVDAVRMAFAHHVVAVESLRRVWGETSLSEALEVEAEELEWLLETRSGIDDRLRTAGSAVGPAAVERARAALILERAPFEAALAVRPRLERVVAAEGSEALAHALPGASAREYEHVYAAVVPAEDPAIRPDRSVVDAIVLRCEMRAHVEALAVPPEPDSLARLERDRSAYRFVSGRLQARCGALLEQRKRHEAEFAADVRKSLFAAFRDVTRAIHGETGGADDGDLARRIEAAESAAEEVRAERETRGKVVDEAVRKAADPAPPQEEPLSLRDLKAERRRRRALAVVAAATFVAAVAVNVALWDGASPPPAAPFAPVADALPTAEVLPAGEIVRVEVSTWVWAGMDIDRRRTYVERAVEAARGAGAKAMHVVDETAAELARWTPEGGIEMAAR